MANISQKEAARRFAGYWRGKGYEKGQSQPFWLSLLREVYGVPEPEKYIAFEDQVHLDHTSFIDGFIDSTHVMIEQKGYGKDLEKPIRQSDGSLLTPYQQAKRYSQELPYSRRPRWIVTCNFEKFLIYDMENPSAEPQLLLLKDLPEEYWRMEFLVDDARTQIRKEQEISENAGEIVRQLYNALSSCYGDMSDAVNQKSLNKLIVRLVFCLYAEDADMFGRCQFMDYVAHFDAEDLSDALYRLFEVLDTKEEERRRGLKPILATFPYTNGGLFHDKPDADDTEIPMLTEEVKHILLDVAAPFNWSKISPTIFGGIFESTLNPETRRKGGMHYTSIENIHKVIDPLFLDGLKAEFRSIVAAQPQTTKRDRILEWRQRLLAFQNKLALLKFLDPACGSGNFLTETYLSLRRLENEVIRILYGEGMMGLEDLIKVSIHQFYGIEINDFAVSVATTALWISEAQMLRETESIIAQALPALPLKSYSNICEGNALRLDWNNVIDCKSVDYIFGNPPFVGYKFLSTEQKDDVELIVPGARSFDYVVLWYYKALEYMQGTGTVCAFVSTNSICQGDAIQNVWEGLIKLGAVIQFAWHTFVWDNEANVHCVIVGFSCGDSGRRKYLFGENETPIEVSKINPYLVEGDNVIIQRRGTSLCGMPEMTKGAQLIDGGGFMLEGDEEKENFLRKYPEAEPYIYRYYNSQDFINNNSPRYCLYLQHCPPSLIRGCRGIYDKVESVRQYRAGSDASTTRVLADTPSRFFQPQVPEGNSIIVPVVSSAARKYIPMAFMPAGNVFTNALFYVDNADLYLFGILTSSVHMAWTGILCGRLKSDFRYSNSIVYNNLPFPEVTETQRHRIVSAAQGILDARNLFPEASLADLYDPNSMPTELRRAHQANDAAVMEAYGFPKDASESDIIARLFKMYQELTLR